MCTISGGVLKHLDVQEPQCIPGELKMKKYLYLYFYLNL